MAIIKPMIRIHNATTGEIVDREMNAEEIAQYEKHNEELKRLQDEALAQSTAAEEKLATLGLTIDDLKALGL